MRVFRFLASFALLLVLFSPAAVLANEISEVGDTEIRVALDESATAAMIEAPTCREERRGEDLLTDQEIQFLPNSMSWAMGGDICSTLCNECPTEGCRFSCFLACPRFPGCQLGLSCCGISPSICG